MASRRREMKAKAVFMRFANRKDIPVILSLIRELAKFEELLHECHATEEALNASLFNLPPMQGPTVLLLEIAEDGQSALHPAEGLEKATEKMENIEISEPVEDPEASAFISAYNTNRTVVGFALFFPNYSTFLAKSGIYLEDLCIRLPYRRCGYGTRLLRRLAQLAVENGAGRLEWSVLDWNQKAIDFYTKKIGGVLMNEWRICRLTGATLEAAAKAE